MSPDIPLSVVITEVIRHTPVWVWAILCAITAIGLRQMGDHVLSAKRVSITPVVLGAFSLWGALNAFGTHAAVVTAWIAGLALAAALNVRLRWPREVRYQGAGHYALRGSAWPLAGMLSVFVVRYVTTVTLVLHPGWRHDALFSAAMPLVYGALSGLFLARAVRILHSAPAGDAMSAA